MDGSEFIWKVCLESALQERELYDELGVNVRDIVIDWLPSIGSWNSIPTGEKNMIRFARLFVWAAVIGSICLGEEVAVQAFPAKPLKLIVPYTPVGTTDQLARAVAERLSQALGQAVVVENKPGANTIIGAEAVAKAAPDGYTIFLSSMASLAVNPLLYAKLPYDPKRDFASVTLLGASPLVMVVHPPVPAKTLNEFVVLAKANPGSLNFASVGNGNPLHLAAEMFKSMAGVEMTHVPYNGSGPALTALLGAQVQVMYDLVLTSQPYIKSGKPARAGHHRHQARVDSAGCPDHRRVRLSWLRCGSMVGAFGAQGHAGPHRAASQCRGNQDPAPAGNESALWRTGGGTDSERSGGDERFHRSRASEVGEAGEGPEYPLGSMKG